MTISSRTTPRRRAGGGGEPLVVTFGGQPSKLTTTGFGTDFAQANGWDTIYVAQKAGSQYQGLDLETFASAIGPVAEGREVVCYGSSLGGYAALYFGGSIDARIIAAAPLLPAWPPLGYRSYKDVPIHHAELWEVPTASRAPVVIFDPHREDDLYMVEKMVLRAYPEAKLIEYPHAGHPVLETLRNTGQIRGFITPLIAEGSITPIKPLGDGDADYHRNKAMLIRRSDPPAAARELRRSLDLAPSRGTLSVLLTLLIHIGRLEEAQCLIDHAEASGDERLTIIPGTHRKAAEAGLRVAPLS